MPGVPNGTACQVEEELHAEHHGPELQRTGRWALIYGASLRKMCDVKLSCWFPKWKWNKPFESLPLITKWFGTYHFCRDVLRPVAIIRTRQHGCHLRWSQNLNRDLWGETEVWQAGDSHGGRVRQPEGQTHRRTQKCSDFKLFNVEKNTVLP